MAIHHVLRHSLAAVVKKFERDTKKAISSDNISAPKATIEHLIAVKSDNRQLHCIHVEQILYKSFLIDTGGASIYLGVAPNSLETF